MKKEKIKLTIKVKLKLAGILVLMITGIILGISFIKSEPNGASVIPGESSNAISDNSTSIGAVAGNITQININGISITQAWQGYYGNVSGGMQLSDASGNVFYNWTAVNAIGEVYAARNSTITWTNVQCFNYTAAGNYSDDSGNQGATSLFGLNETLLENLYNITSSDSDGISETFQNRNHAQFYTNGQQFSSGECFNTKLLNNSGQGIFDEVLLYSPESRDIIFTSILRDNTMAYNGRTADFEMMVLDDGHGTNTAPSDYYFYIELG